MARGQQESADLTQEKKKMTERYRHLSEEHLLAAINYLDAPGTKEAQC